MSDLLNKLRDINQKTAEEHQAAVAAAVDAFAEMAVRDHLGKLRKDDPERLAAVLQMLDRTEAEYAKTLSSIGQVSDLFGQLEFYTQAEKKSKELAVLKEEERRRAKILNDISSKMFALVRIPDERLVSKLRDEGRNAPSLHKHLFSGNQPHEALRPIIEAKAASYHAAWTAKNKAAADWLQATTEFFDQAAALLEKLST